MVEATKMADLKEIMDKYAEAKTQSTAMTAELGQVKAKVTELETKLADQAKTLVTPEQQLKEEMQKELQRRSEDLTKAETSLGQGNYIESYSLLHPGEPLPGKINPKNKNLAFLIDSSGSTRDNVFPLMAEGVTEAFDICSGEVAVINFSDGTLYSGWHPSRKNTKQGEAFNFKPYLKFLGGISGELDKSSVLELLIDYKTTHQEPFTAVMTIDPVLENYEEVESSLRFFKKIGSELIVICLTKEGESVPPELKRMEDCATVYVVDRNQAKEKILEVVNDRVE